MTIDIRNIAFALAALLGLYSVWLALAEYSRPGLSVRSAFPFPVNPQKINSQRFAADFAARVGLIRGDLWAERALVDSGNVIGEQSKPNPSYTAEDAASVNMAARRALSWSPIDGRVWLLLATLTASRPGMDDPAKQQLKMSYLTAPNDKEEIAPRFKLVMDSHALDDAELRDLVRRELRTILLRIPELKPLLVKLYAQANPEDRGFIKITAAAINPDFAASLEDTTQK